MTYVHPAGTSVGILVGNGVVDLNSWNGRSPGDRDWLCDFRDVLNAEGGIEVWRSASSAEPTAKLTDLRLMPPVLTPSKVVGVGMNYRSFARQLGEPDPVYLSVFHKTASALNAHLGSIERPGYVRELVPEGEVAVIIGRRARRVDVTEALARVGAVTCANDISARDLEFRTSQWTAGKMLPTSCPLGPIAVTPDEVDLEAGLEIRTYLDGVEIQRGHTADMVFPIATLIASLSELVDLEVGDVVLTGTPSDLGAYDPPILLRHGAQVDVEIVGVGRLSNSVREL